MSVNTCYLGCKLILIILVLCCGFVSAENMNTHISNNLFEVSFDNSTYQFWHPLEHGIDRTIKIKNLGNEPVDIELRSYAKHDGIEEEVRSFPQPFPNHFEPNEEKEIFLKLEFDNNVYSKWIKDKTYKIPFTIEVFTFKNNQKESKSVLLQNEVYVLEKLENSNNLPKNSQVKGSVIDDLTNKPIQGVKVRVWSDWPYYSYETTTDSNGNFEAGIYAYKKRISQQYIPYSITIEADRYERYNFAYSPKENEIKEISAKLKLKEERGNYNLISQYDTGLPTYKGAISKDGQLFVVVPFHSSEKIDIIKDKAYLHLFSSEGKIVCKYKLDNEVPTVDISDDGTLIATIHRKLQDNWGGGEGIIVLDNNCNEVWAQDGLGSEIWMQENVAIATGGPSEVKISHNKEYLAVGTFDGRLYLFNLSSKKLIWNYSTNLGQSRYILFDDDDSGVYFSADPLLFRYKIDGNLDWKVNVGSWVYSFVLSENYAFVGVKAGRFVSLINKTSGKIIWKYSVESRPDNVLISPDESYLVYQDSNGGISIKNAFFDINGNLLFNLNGANSGRITNDSNYIVYQSGESVELINRMGDRLWSYQLGKMKWPAPNGFIYISDNKENIIVADPIDGMVYFFEGKIEKENYQNISTNKDKPEHFLQSVIDWFSKIFI